MLIKPGLWVSELIISLTRTNEVNIGNTGRACGTLSLAARLLDIGQADRQLRALARSVFAYNVI